MSITSAFLKKKDQMLKQLLAVLSKIYFQYFYMFLIGKRESFSFC